MHHLWGCLSLALVLSPSLMSVSLLENFCVYSLCVFPFLCLQVDWHFHNFLSCCRSSSWWFCRPCPIPSRTQAQFDHPLSTIPIHTLPPASFLFPTTTAAYIELLHSPRPRPRPFWVSKVIRYIFGQQQLIPTGCVCFHLQLHFSNDPESPPYHYIHVYMCDCVCGWVYYVICLLSKLKKSFGLCTQNKHGTILS